MLHTVFNNVYDCFLCPFEIAEEFAVSFNVKNLAAKLNRNEQGRNRFVYQFKQTDFFICKGWI